MKDPAGHVRVYALFAIFIYLQTIIVLRVAIEETITKVNDTE